VSTYLFPPIQTLLAQVKADVLAGNTTAATTDLDALTTAVQSAQNVYEPVTFDPWAPTLTRGTHPAETSFIFQYDGVLAPHPMQGKMCRYVHENGNMRGLLGYETSFCLWFTAPTPIVQKVLWGDGKLHDGYMFADNGRLCVAETATDRARGAIPVIAMPFDAPVLEYPKVLDPATGKLVADPRNIPPFSNQQLAQGRGGPAEAYFVQLTNMINRMKAGNAASGTNPAIPGFDMAWFRLRHEHTGNWYRNGAVAGGAGWFILASNAVAACIKAAMPKAKVMWNMAREVSAGMAPMYDSIFMPAADAAAINATGLIGRTVTAGEPIQTDCLSYDPYNGNYASTSKVTNTMTAAQLTSTYTSRSVNEGFDRYSQLLENAADILGVPLAVPEWGTGYDSSGVPKISGIAVRGNGKAGGDDAYYIERGFYWQMKWNRAGKLLMSNPWERHAGDGDTALSYSSNVNHRTGRVSTLVDSPTSPDPSQKLLASRRFVELFGVLFRG
jgi:hypothetical protein